MGLDLYLEAKITEKATAPPSAKIRRAMNGHSGCSIHFEQPSVMSETNQSLSGR